MIVLQVKEAVAQVRERRPDILVEGPIQYDAAVDPGIAAIKIKVGRGIIETSWHNSPQQPSAVEQGGGSGFGVYFMRLWLPCRATVRWPARRMC